MQKISSAAFSDTKPHYELLDGLRGVAALVVIWYHIFEGFATSPIDQRFNHGYLAVDFFFILSGFVVGYAYDDRWKKKTMGTGDFFKRRLIRLHPMVVLGAVLGLITFLLQGSQKWDGASVGLSLVLLAFLLNLFLIPAYPGAAHEVRGNGEMYPLNGPNWSLFFEYIGNILYALCLRRLSTKALGTLVVVAAVALTGFAVGNLSGFGHLGVGWTLAGHNFLGGFLRLTFAFSAGLFLSRIFKPVYIRGAFWICSLAVIVLLSMPYVGDAETPWVNGLYDAVCVVLVFPVLVYFGASGRASDSGTAGVCKFLGDVSYPVYVVHYPFMYLFYAWLWSGGGMGLSFTQCWAVPVGLFLGSILLAYLCLKLYDEPLRRYLARRYLHGKQK